MAARSQSNLSLNQMDGSREDGSSAAPPQQNPVSGPVNLSGLVCNVRRTTGREPRPLVGASTTVLGDKLYVFGGRVLSRSRPRLSSSLYELDLIRRHWTKLETFGDIPPPRYFHSVCALGDNKLVCYGGMSPVTDGDGSQNAGQQVGQDGQPEVKVMSDIHIYDIPTRTWTRIHTKDAPQGRYAHCATILPSSACFTSTSAPLSAIHNNPSSSNPHQGTIGIDIDGTGGAEMIVVGGQDSSNHYIEQISVFNFRSLKWTSTTHLGRSCGAYRSVVAPLTTMDVSEIGAGQGNATTVERQGEGTSMLIYSNYNFLDVKLELQVRLPDGRLIEKPVTGEVSPPGLRFPNGGVVGNHFIVSGTYLTSSKQEYALWVLDLKTLTWSRIDAGGSVFSSGSWNRGVLWERRNAFVVLGHRKRSLVDDYNHRQLNFSHMCVVELETYGLYNNPCRTAPTSGYVSVSAPAVPASLRPKLMQLTFGGRPFSKASDELGRVALAMTEFADMEIQALGGEKIPVNSRILSRRWGPYFIQLLRESSDSGASDVATLRATLGSGPNRNSAITITSAVSGSTLVNSEHALPRLLGNLELPTAHTLPPATRPRVLYLPHTVHTIRLLLYYLYTSSLPPVSSPLCTPQTLCSILQIARPYQIDGLLEATVERLHEVLDGRNAAAVFNAAAMAAGGGRGTGFLSGPSGTLEVLNEEVSNGYDGQQTMLRPDTSESEAEHPTRPGASKHPQLRIDTNLPSRSGDEDDELNTATSAATSASFSQSESEAAGDEAGPRRRGRRNTDTDERAVWTGGVSSVIGLQKRGLRGLIEGRRLRERGKSATGSAGSGGGSAGSGAGGPVGLGVGEVHASS
ncbi:hypothetical protein VTN49DRAFT_4083 [Thermomyces lanuginosus]|uniref:uncharacterized protein n=1 Tax=Thermomyces lanuginosus TaxID=5541 RepID=UPI003743A58C